jgi:D-glycero-beta-D-manno-heptose 1-phosphate adenylyltransferase
MPSQEKIRSLAAAVKRREMLRAEGKTVVLTNGVFDLLHEGHLHYLGHASKLGDALFVALNSDTSTRQLKGPERPIERQDKRAQALAQISYVDTVIIFDGVRLVQEISALRPDLYCKAGDYTLDKLDPDELSALKSVGADIRFLPFLPGHSTTAKIRKLQAEGK